MRTECPDFMSRQTYTGYAQYTGYGEAARVATAFVVEKQEPALGGGGGTVFA